MSSLLFFNRHSRQESLLYSVPNDGQGERRRSHLRSDTAPWWSRVIFHSLPKWKHPNTIYPGLRLPEGLSLSSRSFLTVLPTSPCCWHHHNVMYTFIIPVPAYLFCLMVQDTFTECLPRARRLLPPQTGIFRLYLIYSLYCNRAWILSFSWPFP